MDWYKASQFCKDLDMELVSVESEREWNALVPSIRKLRTKHNAHPWSSGSDAELEGIWRWAATGEIIKYNRYQQHWLHKDTKQNCLYIKEEYWDDRECSAIASFICEMSLSC